MNNFNFEGIEPPKTDSQGNLIMDSGAVPIDEENTTQEGGIFQKYTTNKDVKEDKQIYLEHGKPMVFGKDREKGLVLNKLKLEVVTIGENGVTQEDLLVHDAKEKDPTLHQMLVRLEYTMATGIIRSFEDITFEEREDALTKQVKANSKFKKTDDLFFSGETYIVK